MQDRSRFPYQDTLRELMRAGVGSLPGTSAEILDDGVRAKIAKGRISTAEWVEVGECVVCGGGGCVYIDG